MRNNIKQWRSWLCCETTEKGGGSGDGKDCKDEGDGGFIAGSYRSADDRSDGARPSISVEVERKLFEVEWAGDAESRLIAVT